VCCPHRSLRSAAALASDPTHPAEAPIDFVAPDDEVKKKGETNNNDPAKNDVDDGEKDDDRSNMHDGAHGAGYGGKESTAWSVQGEQEQAHNESGQKDD
jgi:hypothetical protein